jgi:ribonuclease HI
MCHKVVVWLDGGCRNNGSQLARGYCSVRIVGRRDTLLTIDLPGATTNNQAELGALVCALDLLSPMMDFPGSEIELRFDSRNLEGWVFGQFKCKTEALVPLRNAARAGVKILQDAGLKITPVRVDRTEIVAKLGH